MSIHRYRSIHDRKWREERHRARNQYDVRTWREDGYYYMELTPKEPDMTEQLEKSYCVISPTAIARTWCATPEEAAAHGGNLLRNNSASRILYIVKVVAIVRPKADYEVIPVGE